MVLLKQTTIRKTIHPHLSTLFVGAFMDNNFYHLSNYYSVFIAVRASADILAGDNRANRSVSLTRRRESGYLFVFERDFSCTNIYQYQYQYIPIYTNIYRYIPIYIDSPPRKRIFICLFRDFSSFLGPRLTRKKRHLFVFSYV